MQKWWDKYRNKVRKKDKEKFKGQLPTGWKALKDLSKEQILKIQGINADYRGKIHDLEEKIKDLKVKARGEQFKVLTVEQKDHLRKIAIGEETGKDKKDKDKKDKDKDK